MKKTFTTLLLLTLAGTLLSGNRYMHEFYVSLTEIRFNDASGRIEVSMRIFPDDMDRAMNEHFGLQTNLVTEIEHLKADSLLGVYLINQFAIYLDGKQIRLKYLGKEAESDVMWCYMESEQLSKPSEITVSNPILTEIFEDQVNIIQVYAGKWNRGLLLSRDKPQGHLVIDR